MPNPEPSTTVELDSEQLEMIGQYRQIVGQEGADPETVLKGMQKTALELARSVDKNGVDAETVRRTLNAMKGGE